MLCKVLNTLYGRDTRPAQMLNILFSTMWVVGLSLHLTNVVALDLPAIMLPGVADMLAISVGSLIFSLLGFVTKGQRHQVLKFFGISIGAVLQGILANGYFTMYPPLEVMLVINLVVMFWFLGALLYIARCEGFDGKYTRKP